MTVLGGSPVQEGQIRWQDPDAKLDWAVNWSTWLADGETVVESTWTVDPPAELTADEATLTDGKATVWLSGGTLGRTYRVVNHVRTSLGREDDRSLKIHVTHR